MSMLVYALFLLFALAAGKSITPPYYYVPGFNPITYSSAGHIPQHTYTTVYQAGVPDKIFHSAQPPVQVVDQVYIPTEYSYHTQDGQGAYSFGYYGGPDSRMEHRDAHGNVVGAYNYIDAHGKVQSAQYTSGKRGFQIKATNLPVGPIEDTDAVKKAKAEFKKVFDSHKTKSSRTKRNADPLFHYSTQTLAGPFIRTDPQVYPKPIFYTVIGHPSYDPHHKTIKHKITKQETDDNTPTPILYTAGDVNHLVVHPNVAPIVHQISPFPHNPKFYSHQYPADSYPLINQYETQNVAGFPHFIVPHHHHNFVPHHDHIAGPPHHHKEITQKKTH